MSDNYAEDTMRRLKALQVSKNVMDRLTEACDAISGYLRRSGNEALADAFDEVWMAEPEDDWE